jgi:MinD-like ATPase involved in chromosome partitioning or flagellar assembly
MSKIIAINSFRRGVGRSKIGVNLSVLLALAGRRVGIVDANLQAPSLHLLFNQDESQLPTLLNHYLERNCDLKQAVYRVTAHAGQNVPGEIFLIPGSTRIDAVRQILRQGYDTGLLNRGFQDLLESFDLDVLFVDTQQGVNEETLFLIAIADILLLLLRTDQQDYWGTGITVQVAQKLNVPQVWLVVNEVPASFDPESIKSEVEQAYGYKVAAVLPHVEEMMTLASNQVFVLHYPDHPMTADLQQIIKSLDL